MAYDANLFQTFKIGTNLHERLTNAFSRQDRTLLRLQNFHERLLPILLVHPLFQ